MDNTGQFASVLLHAASISSFLAFAVTVVLIVAPINLGESGGFSASATVSTLTISILLCLHTSAKIVTAQSAKAIIANSTAVGPVSVPPAAVERSQTTLCVLELSTTERTFPIHFAVALYLGIVPPKQPTLPKKLRLVEIARVSHSLGLGGNSPVI